MKMRPTIYNFFLSILLTLIGLGVCLADPNPHVKWSIDLKRMLVKYSVTNKDTTTIKWSSQVLVFCRQDDDKSIVPSLASDPALASDGVIHPYIEIITHPINGSQVESLGGIAPPPIEIKAGETHDFSYSIADAGIFNADTADVSQIKSASFQLAFDGKLISSTVLDYVDGKWKAVAP